MPLANAARIPSSTYRFQLHKGFSFSSVEELLGYLSALGISDIYFSPIFKATPGSKHGYDVSDFGEVNPELGGERAFRSLSAEIQKRGLGVLVDMVPNHMGIAGPTNRWWRSVLENGENSEFAGFFDIHWSVAGDWRHRVLVPMLEDHYDRMLTEGKISVEYQGEFSVRYGEASLPLNPRSYATILRPLTISSKLSVEDRKKVSEMVQMSEAVPFERAESSEVVSRIGAQVLDLKRKLSAVSEVSPPIREQIDLRLREINGMVGDEKSFTSLHALLEEQHYRIARWKTGAHEINYRRFFAIDSLVGLRVERPEVFGASHALLEQLVADGIITGLRIDHIDGLRLPREYLEKLQRLKRPDSSRSLYVLVEKILATDEVLPAWPVHGTTGYEFIQSLADVLVNPDAFAILESAYKNFTGDGETYDDTVYEKKKLVLDELFATAINNLGTRLSEIVSGDRKWQDLTRVELVLAVRELIAALPVYRTYREPNRRLSDEESDIVTRTTERALSRNPRLDTEPFEFLKRVLCGDFPDEGSKLSEPLLEWCLTFQQYTGAVMAKAVEDTAFYVYNRFVGLNEVGGNPSRFGAGVSSFHQANLARLRSAPHSLLATSTHDTKVSEDVRARLYAISEMAREWQEWVATWHEQTRGIRTRVGDGEAPDTNDEYRFYQILLCLWPLTEEGLKGDFKDRLKAYFRKAVDEAKRHTSPLKPNQEYLRACDEFVDGVIEEGRLPDFSESFRRAAAKISRVGAVNSLTQLLLKCTAPGVPDIYQGSETWDFSLVDPDNRRPVDFRERATLLSAVSERTPLELMEQWRDGGIKIFLTKTLLNHRKNNQEIYARGDYVPLYGKGTFGKHIVAFTRSLGDKLILVAACRLVSELGLPPLGLCWQDTVLPNPRLGANWKNILTNKILPSSHEFRAAGLFEELPFAVLELCQ